MRLEGKDMKIDIMPTDISLSVVPVGLVKNQSLRVLRLDHNSVTCPGIPTELLSRSDSAVC